MYVRMARFEGRFAETEDDVRRADETLNAMSPPEDSGMRRTGVEIYEVALDESF
jgi:hypothetical protein